MEELFHGRSQSGHIFSLYGDLEALKEWAKPFLNWKPDIDETEEDEDLEEYSLHYCDKDTSGARFTIEEREADIQQLRDVLNAIENDGWLEYFVKLPRKKNKTLAKNRVVVLWRGETFQHYWEDSYGFNAPELRLKSFDDYKAQLQPTSTVVGY